MDFYPVDSSRPIAYRLQSEQLAVITPCTCLKNMLLITIYAYVSILKILHLQISRVVLQRDCLSPLTCSFIPNIKSENIVNLGSP